MDEQELLKERFKSAVSSTVKAISENFDLQIKFGSNIDSKKNSLNLPEVANLKKLQDFTNVRAFADSEALKIKYTDKKIYLENEPKGSMSKALYAIAEKIRYEKIGSNKLKGVKNNITQCYENKFKKKRIEEIKTEADVPVTEAFELYLRNHFFKIKQNQATKKILSYWKKLFDKNLSSKLTQLDNCIENQSTYSHQVANLIANFGLEDSDSKKREESTNENSSSPEKNNNDNNSFQKEEEQSTDSDLNVAENNFDSFSEEDDSEQKSEKEVTTNQSSLNKNLSKDKKMNSLIIKYDKVQHKSTNILLNYF